jgi:hypothetical protein
VSVFVVLLRGMNMGAISRNCHPEKRSDEGSAFCAFMQHRLAASRAKMPLSPVTSEACGSAALYRGASAFRPVKTTHNRPGGLC